ncbi:MAG: hypothetical protein ABJE13_00050, partial [Reichenbachiella sp.]
ASVITTNGNLHLDSKNGKATYINHYSSGNTYLNTNAGTVAIGTSNPDLNAGLHIYRDRYTIYGPNSTWSAYLQVGGNGRQTTNASVLTTNGNLHLDSKNGKATYINHYSSGNSYLNTNGGNVGIGTTDPKSKLAVNGQIRATEVKVLTDISVPDYVFEEGYKLRTLKETKEFIAKEKHLPEIPSATEIGKNGIDLGDMNMRLLKKIEELTLYQIELLERMEKLESKTK